MQTKYLLFPIALTCGIMLGCSDDPASADNVVGGTTALDSLQQEPYIDPLTGEVISASYSSAAVPGSSGSVIPQSGGTHGNPPGSNGSGTSNGGKGKSSAAVPGSSGSVPVSSIALIGQSSSSGLKEYDDNHKAKETFLPKAGFYKSLTIDPPTPRQGGQIKCTFDGSFPTQNSEQLTAAKQITQNTVIRCSEFVNGKAVDTTTQTYFINESVSIPVVALTVNHHDMFDSSAGLYATGDLNQGGQGQWGGGMNFDVGGDDTNNPKCTEPCRQANFWKDDELPVHVEYFEKGSSTTEKTWEIDAGISIIGNYSRYKPKKSVAIKMDNDDYGDKVLKYSFFNTRPEAKKIKSFNLRNNGNRFWTDYFGDPMLVSLMEGTDVDYQRSLMVVVFYNGEYFGIHDLRERLNRSFVETNYGIDSKSINVVKNCSNGDQGCVSGWAPSGTNGASSAEFGQLVNSITGGNFAGENNTSYAEVKQKMNVSSFAQYMVAEMYIHNGDWPNNNIRAWGSPSAGIPFKFMIFDVDHGYGFTPGIMGFDTESQNMFQWVLGSATMQGGQGGQQGGGMTGGFGGGGMIGGFGGGGGNTAIGNMLKKLLENPDFKRLFINQGCILLNDYLTYEKVQAGVQKFLAMLPSSERQRDTQRWPRNQAKYNWSPEGGDILRFAQNRTQTFRQEMGNYFGFTSEANVSISTSGSGTVLVEGMKLPKTPYQGKFFSGMEMELTAVPTNGGVFNGWSDGSNENPHKIQVTGNVNITAQFK